MLIVIGVGVGLALAIAGLVFLAALKSDSFWGALCAGLIGIAVAIIGFFDFEWLPSPRGLMVAAGVSDTTANSLALLGIAALVAASLLAVMSRFGWVSALSRRFGAPSGSSDE